MFEVENIWFVISSISHNHCTIHVWKLSNLKKPIDFGEGISQFTQYTASKYPRIESAKKMCQPLLIPVSILLHKIGYSYLNTGICFGIMMGAVVNKSMADLRYFGKNLLSTQQGSCGQNALIKSWKCNVSGAHSLFIRVPSAAYGQRVTPLFAV